MNSNENTSQKKPILALDIGTCYCRASVFLDGKVQPIPSKKGNILIPSYVAFTPNGDIIVGEEAYNLLETSSLKNVVFGLKRLIGKKFADLSVQNEVKFLPYTLVNRKREGKRPYIEMSFMEGLKIFYIKF